MEQNFVVLTDGRRAPALTQTPQNGPRGQSKKRPMEDKQLVLNRNRGARVEKGARGGRGGGGRGTFKFSVRGTAKGSNQSTPRI